MAPSHDDGLSEAERQAAADAQAEAARQQAEADAKAADAAAATKAKAEAKNKATGDDGPVQVDVQPDAGEPREDPPILGFDDPVEQAAHAAEKADAQTVDLDALFEAKD